MFYYFYTFSGTDITICADSKAIKAIHFGKTAPVKGVLEKTLLIKSAVNQLEEYFSGIRKSFELPLEPEGTAFQKKVWECLLRIPYGETRTYGEIAKEIGNPNASRAVGGANNKNPIAIVIPCHRVIGADGSLTGYAGGLDYKKLLLNIENNLTNILF